MSDASPDNSTFAERRRKRDAATKQVVAGQTYDKALAAPIPEPVPPPTPPPPPPTRRTAAK